MVQQAISFITTAIMGTEETPGILGLFYQLLDATETYELWLAGITFVLFVSIILMPFRGGNPIGSGGFVGFVANRVNSHKKSSRKTANDD